MYPLTADWLSMYSKRNLSTQARLVGWTTWLSGCWERGLKSDNRLMGDGGEGGDLDGKLDHYDCNEQISLTRFYVYEGHSFPSQSLVSINVLVLDWYPLHCNLSKKNFKTICKFGSMHATMQVCSKIYIDMFIVQVYSSDSSKCASVQVCKFDSMQVCKCGGDGPSPRSFEGRIRSGPAEYPPHTISC